MYYNNFILLTIASDYALLIVPTSLRKKTRKCDTIRHLNS